MPVGKFDETLEVVMGTAKGKAGPVQAHIVKARGPLDNGVARIVELCVWVLQRADLTKDDAAANAMGPEGTGMPGMDMVVVNPARTTWEMDLTDRDETEGVDFVAGSATALAIGVFLTDAGKLRSFVWSEPVVIRPPTAA